MQRFVAELSVLIDRGDFEKSWQTEAITKSSQPKVDFVFAGSRVSSAVHSETANPWPSASFHATFSATIRRLNGACNVRWL
jgi:hypothetical protein